jgi:hypothetical protein
LDIQTPNVPEIARNGNQGSKWAYFYENGTFLAGLNGAFLILVFRVSDYWAYNGE